MLNEPTTLTRKQLVGGLALALALGWAGAMAGSLYNHHSLQHHKAEELEKAFVQFQRDVAQAVNQLAQQSRPPQ